MTVFMDAFVLCVAVSTYAHSHVDKRPAKITHKMRDNGNNKQVKGWD
jgi:hypothetical protein